MLKQKGQQRFLWFSEYHGCRDPEVGSFLTDGCGAEHVCVAADGGDCREFVREFCGEPVRFCRRGGL